MLNTTKDTPVPLFEPGQYITIRLQIPGEEYLFNRQYSLSVAPGKEYFRISVKREADGTSPDGKVSNYLHDHINAGDILEVTAPAGVFILDTKKQTPIVFISGGVGITPFISMASAIAEVQPVRQVQFIHAARNGRVQAFKNELKTLKGALQNFELYYVYEQPAEQDHKDEFFAKEGFIDSEWLNEHITGSEADYYVCGPVPFLRTIVGSLKKFGVDDAQINYEFFGPAASLEA
ncbi:FAD-binding oxidoreductase [Peribacillus glennii]|uniref:nitric oxide dioxygenase n=1 Tax=Peribacillus glennii TaxID=2303991 RepID=A0A372LGR1_9BACI|nr:FAD-binding oxidoreductase [Peribacillus glennii]RFU65477.1 hypothetical protein D0466_06200 [Peribacillus glennii]